MRDRRVAAWLVRAYPRAFREAVGADLADALCDRMRARRRAGMPAAAVVALACADTVRNAPAAWAAAFEDRQHARGAPRDGASSMSDILRQDFRYAVRGWLRRPAVGVIALLTLALGIGANTAMFSIVNAVLVRPLAFRNADRLVMLWGRTPSSPQALVSYPEYREYARGAQTLDAAALWLTQSVNLTGAGEPQRIIGVFVTGSFFDAVGLSAERGRLFDDAESTPGTAQMVTVITRQFWERRFSSDPSAIGSTVTLNGLPLTIVGVLAPPFDKRTAPAGGYFVDVDAFIPAALLPVPGGIEKAGPAFLSIARMKPGISIERAGADLDVIARRLEAANPNEQKDRRVNLISLQETVVGAAKTPLLLLLAAVGAVLLMACVNVGNLLMARAADRQKEIALRAALGASRGAVLRQLIVESLVLASGAGALGLVVGRWALQALSWLEPPNMPIPDVIPLDGTVLAFTLGLSLFVAVACGVAPAIQASRADLGRVLQTGGRRSAGGGRRMRDLLVAAEIALSVTLVGVAGLLLQSMMALQRVNVGFDPDNVLTLQFRLPATKYQTPDDIARFFKSALERVSRAPGVTSAALVRRVPFSGNRGETPYVVEGRPAGAGPDLTAGENIISPGYFRTMRIPLMRGRDFEERDDRRAPGAVIVNHTLARVVWGEEDPVGRRIKVPDGDWLTVVGVVGDVKHLGPSDPPQPQLYLPHYQTPQIFSSLVARTALPPLVVANDVRKAIWSVDKDQPLWAVQPLDAMVSRAAGGTRFLALLLALFAGTAIALAAVGIYGVMAYSVSQRTHEIGIRIALGASAARVRREIVAHGLWLTLGAVIVGGSGAVAAGRIAERLLFDVKPADPAALAGAAAILAIVSIGACYLPARRASNVDPVIALTEE